MQFTFPQSDALERFTWTVGPRGERMETVKKQGLPDEQAIWKSVAGPPSLAILGSLAFPTLMMWHGPYPVARPPAACGPPTCQKCQLPTFASEASCEGAGRSQVSRIPSNHRPPGPEDGPLRYLPHIDDDFMSRHRRHDGNQPAPRSTLSADMRAIPAV